MSKHAVSVEGGPDGPISFRCSERSSVLNAMRAAGLTTITTGCRNGGCGVCKVQLVHGDVQKKPMSKKHISSAEYDANIVLACRIFPRSNVVVRTLNEAE